MKILWRQEAHQRNENNRLDFIESVHVQYCNDAHCLCPLALGSAELNFQNDSERAHDLRVCEDL